jgi:uncharacterized membrane-anchored protein
MSDYLDRTAGLGYVGGSLVLVAVLIVIIGTWRFALGSVAVSNIDNPKAEMFYWVTILFSNTLGTALGDFLADNTWLGLGYEGGALVIMAVLAVIAAGRLVPGMSRTLLFWLAFILTRPLGATLGDILTKTHAQGGFDLGTIGSSAVLAAFLIGCIVLLGGQRRQRPLQQIAHTGGK